MDIDTVEELINQGADVNASSYSEPTPLWNALMRTVKENLSTDLMELLIKKGAD